MTTSVNIGIFWVVINVVLCRVVIDEPQRGWTYTENSGEIITMTCNADCVNSTCAYLWSASDNITHGTTTLDTFRIGNFPRKDGLYIVECTVTNVGYGTTGKCTQTVNVHYPPDVTITDENNTLRCTAKGNPSTYKYIYWTHRLNNVDLRRLNGSQRLDVSSDYENRGTYQCAVSNGVGQDQTASVYVSRNAKPMVLGDYYVNMDISKGDNFNTVFNIYGYPEDVWVIIHKNDNSVTGPLPYIERRQTKNDVNVTFYEQPVPVTGTRLELDIRRMKEEWFGSYDVVIENTEGNTTARVTITPRGPPDMPKFNLLEMSHDTAVFKLTSGFYNGANQTLVIQFRPHIKGSMWSNGSRENVGTEKNRTVVLRVHGLKPETTYVFRAYSYNMYSESGDIRITRTTKEEPSNLAIIVGACVGAVVVLVIAAVVIAVIVVRKKRRKKSAPRMLPKLDMPNILASSQTNLETPTPDIYENTGKSAMLYKNNDGDLYENTHINTQSSTSSVKTPENNYANVPLVVGASFKSTQGQKKSPEEPIIYTNTNGMHGIAEARAAAAADAENLADKPDPLGYITLDSQHTAEIPDEDYLDMEVTTPIKKSASVSTPSSFNYITPTSLGRSLTSNKKMPEMKKEDSMELYMDMDEERRDSVPDYRAPPPPPAPLPHTDTAGDDYVNLRKKGKQPF